MAHVNARLNNYVRAFGPTYDDVPKAVWAAIAISFATSGGDFMDDAVDRVLCEWAVLADNGIVQRPPARLARPLPVAD